MMTLLPQFGKWLVLFGGVIIVVGVIMLFADRLPFLGKLPGDFSFKTSNFTVYIPVVTSIILSVILTILLNLFFRGR